MSTRAIIAIPTAKGYKTAWCWCDGQPPFLGSTLKRYFKTKEAVNELLSHHSFTSVMTEEDLKDFLKWRSANNIRPGEDRFISLSNGTFLHMDKHDGKVVFGTGRYGFFRSIKRMLEEDIDYAYVFTDGKWKTFS